MNTMPVIAPMQESYVAYVLNEIAETRGDRTEIDLNIKKVDGLPVNVILVLGHNADKTQLKFAHLKIMSSAIYEMKDDDIDNVRLFVRTYCVEEYGTDIKWQVANVLVDCKLALVKVKFSKLLGVFSNESPPVYSFCEAFELGAETGVISVFEDCCVCYEKTKTLTPCLHSLCIPCWGSVQYTSNDDGETLKLCPLCREELL